MPGFFLRGALVEYSGDFLGPIPNLVIFQFNPEQLARSIEIPPPPTSSSSGGTRQREPDQAGTPPRESFTVTANFSAADDLGNGGIVSAIPRVFGIGPQLAALEKMVYPAGPLSGLLGGVTDAVGAAVASADGEPPEAPIPRQSIPRILFIWGATRILPVRIKSMTITEQKFDAFLNPVQAEVQIGLEVINFASTSTDTIGKGALTYSKGAKDAQAILNLGKAIELAVDIVVF
ncbi:hypothetical protein [Arenimonas oryziterrae]|uniref:Uncharacterized protein n=1 Tax=Arenimonas oryziterrae DSM 21050 = YC6267 TaxID=1121015 RepID=A0A091APV0_9GAMM|nr:hypothetical protein [Arenimonas oryziterrae]KFN42203.1 hypothetical protein N789_14545 [Arenimonas oryziterrae DSM 21050 = YC6267]